MVCVGGIFVGLSGDILFELFPVGVGPDQCLAWCVCLLVTCEAFSNMTGWHGTEY